MKAINIIWDVDNEKDIENLPTEIKIPNGMTDEEEISDYLSDSTGFCHKGFELVEDEIKLTRKEKRTLKTRLYDALWTMCKYHADLYPKKKR